MHRGGPPPSSSQPSSTPSPSHPFSSAPRSYIPSRPPASRSRGPHLGHTQPTPHSHYRNQESNTAQMRSRDRPSSKVQSESVSDVGVTSRGGLSGGSRGGAVLVVENSNISQESVDGQDLSTATFTASVPPPSGSHQFTSRRYQQEQRGTAERGSPQPAVSSSTPDPSLQSSTGAAREASPPAERPVERKSYSLGRRTRSRPADLGSKQPSVDETPARGNASSPSNVGRKGWTGGEGRSQIGVGGMTTELDQDMGRLNLAGQSWSQSPASYIRSEMRGEELFSSHLPIYTKVYSSEVSRRFCVLLLSRVKNSVDPETWFSSSNLESS